MTHWNGHYFPWGAAGRLRIGCFAAHRVLIARHEKATGAVFLTEMGWGVMTLQDRFANRLAENERLCHERRDCFTAQSPRLLPRRVRASPE
jgi:hypothetical protein